MGAMSLPLTVKYESMEHKPGSPDCRSTCGRGQIPDWVTEDGHHGYWSDFVLDILDADGDHVVCFGHDYDEYGRIEADHAKKFVQAVNNHPALVETLAGAILGFNELATYPRRKGDNPQLALDRAQQCIDALEIAKQ